MNTAVKAEPISAANGSPGSAASKSNRPRPTRILPTDRISIGKQFDLLRIYAVASGPTKKVVTLAEVEDIIKMKASTISLASPFFTDIGLLQRIEKGFVPSDAVMNFQRAYQWNPETATHKLAPVISAAWFAERLLPKLSYRALSEDEAINDLAEACAAEPDYKPQLALLLDFLAAAGLIVREGGQVRSTNAQMPERTPAVIADAEAGRTTEGSAPTASKSAVTTAFAQPTEGTVQFHVSVKVDMAEFAGWEASRITAFFGGIAQVLAAKGALEKNSAGS